MSLQARTGRAQASAHFQYSYQWPKKKVAADYYYFALELGILSSCLHIQVFSEVYIALFTKNFKKSNTTYVFVLYKMYG